MDQHPEAAEPCGEPIGVMKSPADPDFLCQRGRGHPGVHEVMTKCGNRVQWGLSSDFPEDDEDAV